MNTAPETAGTASAPAPKARKPRKKWKTFDCTDSTSEALSNLANIEELKQEMEDWKSSLEDNEMEQLPKYEEVETCYDVLEDCYNEIEEIISTLENCEALAELLAAPVTYSNDDTYGRKSQPRWMRCSNVASALSAAKEALEEGFNVDTFEGLNEDELEDMKGHVEELGSKIDELEQVEFPGMY